MMLTETFDFDYCIEADAAGWATLRLQINGEWKNYGVSYLHDSLSDLADAGVRLHEGAALTDARVLFVEEPGELVFWLSAAEGGESVTLTVTWADDWREFAGFTRFQTVTLWRGSVSRTILATKIADILTHIFRTLGVDGYAASWQRADFPLMQYRRLGGS